MIIQSIALLDQLDKDINTFAMRVREWYSWHFPELVRIIPDNIQYARLVMLIKDKSSLIPDSKDDNEIVEKLNEVIMNEEKCYDVIDAARSSMGTDVSPIDLINIERFAGRVVSLAEYRASLHRYLISKMHAVAPNLAALIGEQIGARLISHAGSLTSLAKYPASTVQILGAEKALFRALKTKGKTPKYGLLYHSTFIGRAKMKNKGRISRYLANKCSIASRVDCFGEGASDVFGVKLREQVEERLRFYDSGAAPRKNIDVMREAVKQANAEDRKVPENGEHPNSAMDVDGEENSTKDDGDSKDEKAANGGETPLKTPEKEKRSKEKKHKKDKTGKKKKRKREEADEEEHKAGKKSSERKKKKRRKSKSGDVE